MKQRQPWFVGVAMRALGAHVRNTRTAFTEGQLAGWAPEFAQAPGMAAMAMKILRNHALMQPCDHTAGKADGAVVNPAPRWTLTEKGLTICQAVAHAQQPAPAQGNTLAARVWALLRIRGQLTSDEAVSLLADAGQATGRMQRRVADCLRTWATAAPDVVQISARRVAGCKRYVLVRDIGMRHPPLDGRPHVEPPVFAEVPEQYQATQGDAA